MSKAICKENLGMIDRLVRAGIAFGVIKQGLNTKGLAGPLIVGGGILMLIPSVTGSCPLMSKFGASTRPGDNNYFMNLAKQVLPGYGSKPLSNEQATPKYFARNRKGIILHTLADLLAMG
jgi:hypothetical protein